MDWLKAVFSSLLWTMAAHATIYTLTEERPFLCGPCLDIIRRTVTECSAVELNSGAREDSSCFRPRSHCDPDSLCLSMSKNHHIWWCAMIWVPAAVVMENLLSLTRKASYISCHSAIACVCTYTYVRCIHTTWRSGCSDVRFTFVTRISWYLEVAYLAAYLVFNIRDALIKCLHKLNVYQNEVQADGWLAVFAAVPYPSKWLMVRHKLHGRNEGRKQSVSLPEIKPQVTHLICNRNNF
jgi:hypothetical protein